MVERGGSLGLTPESFQGLAVLGEFLGQELQGDGALELGVLGLVHHAHAPAPELLQDAIVGNGLADHEAITSQQDAGELPIASAYAACTGKSTQQDYRNRTIGRWCHSEWDPFRNTCHSCESGNPAPRRRIPNDEGY